MKIKISKPVIIIFIITVIMLALTILLMYISAKQQANNTYIAIDTDTIELIQLDEPKENAPIAIVDTTLGELRFVLYPEQSPNAVQNFIDLAESGYYDGTYVFHSESGAYSAVGSKLKTGEMPEDYDVSRELIERELNQNLWTFKGAVCSLNTTIERSFKEKIFGGGTYYNGSRFAFINTIEFDEETSQQLLEYSASQELGQAFIDKGGIPNFAQQMTVIGQVYDGLEIVEALANLETENSGVYKIPKEDIMINSIVISEYTAENTD